MAVFNLMASRRWNPLSYRYFLEWLNHPFQTSPEPLVDLQLVLDSNICTKGQ
jgi:hypothetical protein